MAGHFQAGRLCAARGSRAPGTSGLVFSGPILIMCLLKNVVPAHGVLVPPPCGVRARVRGTIVLNFTFAHHSGSCSPKEPRVRSRPTGSNMLSVLSKSGGIKENLRAVSSCRSRQLDGMSAVGGVLPCSGGSRTVFVSPYGIDMHPSALPRLTLRSTKSAGVVLGVVICSTTKRDPRRLCLSHRRFF